MAHLICGTTNKKRNLFENMRKFTCKYSISSISLVLAGLMGAAMQSGSAAEARHTMQLVKSTAEVTRPLLSARYARSPDSLPL